MIVAMKDRILSFANARYFPIALVGESNFQPAIFRSQEGFVAKIYHEVDNPYDDRALVVKNRDDETIGYIPRDSFLHRALLDERQDCDAEIKAITEKRGTAGVVISVGIVKNGHTVAQCEFQR